MSERQITDSISENLTDSDLENIDHISISLIYNPYVLLDIKS